VKVRVIVTLKPGVLDSQGRAVHHALGDLGYSDVDDVRTGKVVELEVATDDPELAKRQVGEMCEKLLANPVIEQYQVTLIEGE